MEEAGQDVGEAPSAAQSIDLEKELGEDIHIGAAAAPIPVVARASAAPIAKAPTVPLQAPKAESSSQAPVPAAQVAQSVAAAPQAPKSAPITVMPPIPSVPTAKAEPKAPDLPTPPAPAPVLPAPPAPAPAAPKPVPATPAPAAAPVAPKPAPAAPLKTVEAKSAILPGVVRTIAAETSVPRPLNSGSVMDELRSQAASPLHPLRTMAADEKTAAPKPASVPAAQAPVPPKPDAAVPSAAIEAGPKAQPPRPFVAPTAFKELPAVPSGATAKPAAPAVPHISVMHPEAMPGAKPKVMPESAPVEAPKVAPETKPAPKPVPQNLPGLPKAAAAVEASRIDPLSPLKPLRTYKLDAQESVKANRTSLVAVAAAEERRRTSSVGPQLDVAVRAPFPWKRVVIGVVSVLFIVVGGAAVAYVFMGPPTLEPPTEVQASTILYVDGSTEVEMQGLDHTALTRKLAELRDNAGLSLGLMREFFLTLPNTQTAADEEETAGKRLATTQEAMDILSPNMPDSLLRALQPEFIMGAHIFDGNQAFIVFRTDAYQQAVAGMLEWEYAMRAELSPFFNRNPRPRAPGEATNSTTTPRVIPSSFVDAIVRNHDARVLYNEAGDIILLYAFLDQRTIAVTTNENTLFELASRLKDPLSSALRDIQ